MRRRSAGSFGPDSASWAVSFHKMRWTISLLCAGHRGQCGARVDSHEHGRRRHRYSAHHRHGVIGTDDGRFSGADDKSDGARFEPDGGYQLRVNADGLPSLNAFWFLAAYTAADPTSSPTRRTATGSATRSRPDHGSRWRVDTAPAGRATRNRKHAGELGANSTSAPTVSHPAGVPAATRGHRRCMGMSCITHRVTRPWTRLRPPNAQAE